MYKIYMRSKSISNLKNNEYIVLYDKTQFRY